MYIKKKTKIICFKKIKTIEDYIKQLISKLS